MVRLSTLILSTLSIVSVSAQVSADAQYVLASTASYLAIAQNLAAKAGSIDTLSCTLYHLNMSPFAEIVPILKELTVDFNEDGQRIYSFKPPLSLANPADVAVGRTIEDNLVRATLSVSRALDDIIEGEAINPCSVVPVIGKDISAALKSFKLATIVSCSGFFPFCL
ncbi:hypothetical protein B0T21DRAFT_356338 [Apiosordaria backusii]|uniref:Uncharacterized protein n=1 Tax=Apiosordaria backusii TaxID=314023 RepID=A0AA40EZC4_9PEZI|nr:hypothetical protein B0T21DRAFT_356338 [Apiosordaria backusii]